MGAGSGIELDDAAGNAAAVRAAVEIDAGHLFAAAAELEDVLFFFEADLVGVGLDLLGLELDAALGIERDESVRGGRLVPR